MLGAITFLTVFGPRQTSQQPGSSGFAWFWLVGASIGSAVAGVWWSLSMVASPPVAALVAVLVDMSVTGMLHLDGLADSADGLLAPMKRHRRLEVMRKPDVGAFGVCALVMGLLGRWVALSGGGFNPLVIVGVWSMSRSLAATVPGFVRYARPDGGLASAFLPGATRWLVIGLIPGMIMTVVAEPLAGGLATGALMVGAMLVVALARRQIGGFTGDVLGAVIVVAETVALIVAASITGTGS